MKRLAKAVALGGAAAAGVLALVVRAPLAEDGSKTTWDGIYTEAQAQRGQAAYTASCMKCHGPQLTGTGEAKPLAGPEFLSSWSGLTMGDLFDRVRTTMPLDAPKSLDAQSYADILAYVLKFNGFPAGQGELDRRAEVLAGVRIEAFKPQARAAPASPVSAAAADTPAGANDAPNPYVTETGFLQLPPGRAMGSTSAVAVDSQGHIWVADRCGANDCAGSTLDPIMEFASDGRFIRAFGGGMLLFPHGLFIDAQDHIWITDGHAAPGKGADVLEFGQDGKLIRTLGKPGVSVAGPDSFAQPNAVLVAPDGTIFVADGHDVERHVARIVKFSPDGRFLTQWGEPGAAAGQMDVPHTLAMDSKGRLFVGDRWNNRVDIYDQNGKLLDAWSQFSRPSGVYIDRNDVLYVSDSESRTPEGYGHHPGWKRGVRVGSAVTGKVTAFIPDTYATPDKTATSGAEGIWVDPHGVIYGGQVGQRAVVRYRLAAH
ncbi:c-type cytochrome [Phenylobacterium montanum]|uniref:C-type cytochrome n=1 Tax=Phenylobacterium montanum TaxID=2823693 RepID=A0A975ITF4_9CAUL|nr:c-type cytochrome [Caulobacter sp. S6]QUD86733.1 c-type cytochrome [Caulobacter sp. S6]